MSQNIRRLVQLFRYGRKDAKAISRMPDVKSSKSSIYRDIIRCYFKYGIRSLIYKKEGVWRLSVEQREELGKKCRLEEKWLQEFYDNYRFLIKWSSFKYEASGKLQLKRIDAYRHRYNIGEKCFIGHGVLLHRHHYTDGTIVIGDNCKISEDVNIDYTGGLEVYDAVSIAEGAKILTHNHDISLHDGLLNKSRPVINTPLTINEGAWLGARCIIMPGVTEIGRHAVVSSHTVVVNRVPPYAIVAGNPGKVVGFRLLPDQILEFENKNYPEGKRLSLSSLNKEYDRFVRGGGENLRTVGEDTETISIVRGIVSASIGYQLSPDEDGMPMEQIEGWGSLTNMSIIASVEQHFNVRISSDEMFEMTSVEAIAKVIERKMSGCGGEVYSNIAKLYPHSPIWSKICENIEKFPDKTAIVSNNERITYASLYQHVCKAANLLNRMGLKRGDRIIISAKKDIKFVSLYFASHILGLVNVVIDPESNNSRTEFIESKVQPQHCFGYKSSSFPFSLFDELDIEKEGLLKVNPELLDSDINENDISEILFTTGTTGQPKGVCLSYANIFGSASNINEFIQNTKDDKELIGLPICHSFAMGRLRCNLLKGATVVFIENFGNVKKIFDVLGQEGCTGFGMVPAVWAYLRKASGDKISMFSEQLKYIEIGSSAMPIDDKKSLLRLLPNTRICMHYGLTEASRSTFMEFHDTTHLSSIGKPVTDKVEVKIFNETGHELPDNEKGEICVKGNMVLSRYLDDKDTSVAFWGEYFRTGDMGYKDKDGYLYLVGREKELINVGGKKVSPMEVEDAIISLGVEDCVCAGINDKNGILGEVVKAYILRDGTKLSFSEISEKLSSMLEPYKIPVEYEWIDTIPQTSSGKKKRLSLSK